MPTSSQKAEVKVGFFDIETAPYLGWVWEKYETNVIEFESGGYLLCFSVKWLGKEKIETYSLPEYSKTSDDSALVKKLWEFMNEADIIIAHNGDGFDVKKSNERFLVAGLTPPEPYKTIDTLKVARKHFRFPSNKLDELAKDLGIGRKLAHTGFKLWKDCIDRNKKAWLIMRRYNRQDVLLLEKLYLRLRPWITQHPNFNLYTLKDGCPRCGSHEIQRRGIEYSQKQKYKRIFCTQCRGWSRGEKL